MAFKRSNFGSLRSTKKETFELKYKFSKQVQDFKEGSDVYVIPLGLESGYYETPCHRVLPHKVDGQTIGFGGVNFAVNIKCEGVDEEGNKKSALCCLLAEKERQRVPDDSTKRIISSQSSRIHLPVLILGNSLNDASKKSYPISKVSILNELKRETGLRFSFLDLSSFTFRQDIVCAYGKKLKEDGILDYEMDENSEEFYEEVCHRLAKTIIKIHGVSKQGFTAAMKEYSFFPFDNPSVAAGSGEEERKAITHYNKHKEISARVDEFLQLFNIEVNNLVRSWKEKDLQEYYNSAVGLSLKAPVDAEAPKEVEEKIEVLADEADTQEPISDEEMDALMENPFGDEDPVEETAESNADEELDSFSYDAEEDDAFFEE